MRVELEIDVPRPLLATTGGEAGVCVGSSRDRLDGEACRGNRYIRGVGDRGVTGN